MTLPFWIENEMPERKRMVVTATPIRVDEIRSGFRMGSLILAAGVYVASAYFLWEVRSRVLSLSLGWGTQREHEA
jgi:hypothetical protein